MKTVKFKTAAKFYFILTSIIVITGSCNQPSSNKSDAEKTAIKTELESEISGVFVLFKTSIPSDGEWSEEQDYSSDINDKIEFKEVKDDNSIFYCYDTQELLKIEILGYVENAKVDYISSSNETKSLLSDGNINGQYVVCPTSSNNHLNGGKIIVKSGDKVIKEIAIQYEGCL